MSKWMIKLMRMYSLLGAMFFSRATVHFIMDKNDCWRWIVEGIGTVYLLWYYEHLGELLNSKASPSSKL